MFLWKAIKKRVTVIDVGSDKTVDKYSSKIVGWERGRGCFVVGDMLTM